MHKCLQHAVCRMQSPINILTEPKPAYLQWADDNWSDQAGMAVDMGI